MVDHVEAFGQVEETEKGEFLAVSGGKDVIGYGEESGFRGKARAEAVLGRGK